MAKAIVMTKEKSYLEFSSGIVSDGLELASLVSAAQCQVQDLPAYEQSEEMSHLFNVLEVIKKHTMAIVDDIELSQQRYGLKVSA